MGYDYKPLAGPQALYTPKQNFSYFTVEDINGSQRALYRKFSNTLAKVQVASGDPLEVTGPFTDSQTIYFFGDSDPVLRKSVSGGASSTDISPSGISSVRPVLPLTGDSLDDIVVVGNDLSVLRRDVLGNWTTTGSAPRTPNCGIRSSFIGSKIMLGATTLSGQANTVSSSIDYGETFSDISNGLPINETVTVTSFEGLTGGVVVGPKLESECPDVELFRGRYWRERLNQLPYATSAWDRDQWPVEESCPYICSDGQEWWYDRPIVKPNPWMGASVEHIRVVDCTEFEDGIQYKIELYVYGSAATGISSSALLYHRQFESREEAESSWMRGDANYGSTSFYSVSQSAGSQLISGTLGGPVVYKFVFKPFGWYYRHKFTHPWLSFTLRCGSGNAWPYHFIWYEEFFNGEGPCLTFYCDDLGWEGNYASFGERGYESGGLDQYNSPTEEWEARYPDNAIYDLAKLCVPTTYGSKYYSYAYIGTNDWGEEWGWHYWGEYEYFDLGLGLVHLIGY